MILISDLMCQILIRLDSDTSNGPGMIHCSILGGVASILTQLCGMSLHSPNHATMLDN